MAGFNLADLWVTLGLKSDDLKKGSGEAQSALSGIAKTAAATAIGFVGAGGIAQAIGTVKNAIVGAVKDFAELEKAMAEVSTLVDTSKVDMGNLTDGVLKLSNAYGDTPVGLSRALYQIISAGVDAADSIEFLEVATKAAIGGVTDTKTAVDALTSVINAFGMSASETEKASDILFQTIKAGKTTMAELAPAIGQVAPLAAATGVSLEEMSSALATLTLSGLSTSESATALRGLLNSLLKPTEDAAKFSKQLGIQWGVQALEAKGLKGVLDDIIAKTGGSTKAMSLLVPEVRGLNAALQLAGPQAEKFNEVLSDMEGAAGATDIAAGKMRDTLAFEWKTFTQNVKNAALSLTDTLQPAIRGSIGLLNETFTAFKFWAGVIGDLITREDELTTILAKQNKTAKDYADVIDIARKRLSALTEDGKKTIEEISAENKKRGEQATYYENLIMLSEMAVDALTEEALAEGEAATKGVEATGKKESAKKSAADAEAERYEQSKTRNTEEEKAEKERLRLYEQRAKLAQETAKAIHELEMQEVNRRIEINEAIVADDKQSYAKRQAASVDLERAKLEAMENEKVFQLEMNQRVLQAELDRLTQSKQAEQNDVDDTIDLYKKAAETIEAEFGRKVTKQTEAVIKIEAEVDRTMWQKLGDDVRQNFKNWADELKAGSSGAWSGLVRDANDGIAAVADLFSGMPESVKGPANDITNLIVSALSGNPVQTAVAALRAVGNAIMGGGNEAHKAAIENQRAAYAARDAAKSFLLAAGKYDLSLLSQIEIGELYGDVNTEISKLRNTMTETEFRASKEGQELIRKQTELSDEMLRRSKEVGFITRGITEGDITYERTVAEATSFTGAKTILEGQLRRGQITQQQFVDQLQESAKKFWEQLAPQEFLDVMAMTAEDAFEPIQTEPVDIIGGLGFDITPPNAIMSQADERVTTMERRLDGEVRAANARLSLGEISQQQFKDEIIRLAKAYNKISQEPGLSPTKAVMLRKKAQDTVAGAVSAWQTGAAAGGIPTDTGVNVSAGAGFNAPSPLGKQLGVTLLPGFAVTEGGGPVGFLDAVNTLAQSITGAQPLLPDSMDININVTASGPLTDAQAQQISVGLGEAIVTRMTVQGVVA